MAPKIVLDSGIRQLRKAARQGIALDQIQPATRKRYEYACSLFLRWLSLHGYVLSTLFELDP